MPSTVPRHDGSVPYTSVEWKKGSWLLSCRCLGLITKGRYLTSYAFASQLRRTPEAWSEKHRLPISTLLLPALIPRWPLRSEGQVGVSKSGVGFQAAEHQAQELGGERAWNTQCKQWGCGQEVELVVHVKNFCVYFYLAALGRSCGMQDL